MSEEFKVTPDDLDEFATTMKDLSAQASRSRSYASSYLNIDAEQGRIYASTNELVDEIEANLAANYEKLASLCDSGASASIWNPRPTLNDSRLHYAIRLNASCGPLNSRPKTKRIASPWKSCWIYSRTPEQNSKLTTEVNSDRRTP
ncbi:hypothetical protein [Nocardia lijiangensis]|uniref:hypothetical protein n=1 Tax=Nocardia lijiangensis TaxID=299618 RepID=UPI003D750941